MFPKNRVNIFYRVLCLISFIAVIVFINSIKTLQILFLVYCFFALSEKSFRNIEMIIISIVVFLICYLLNNYIAMKIMLSLDYIIYFLDTSYYVEEEITISEKEYIRFKKKKKKGSNNILAVYLTVHLVVLFLAILVG